MHQKLADCLFYEENIRGSLAELKIAEKAYVPFVVQDPGNMRVQQTVASIYRDEGESYEVLSDWRNAREAYRKVTSILTASLRQDPKNRMWQSHYAETLISLAGTELHLGMKDEAKTHEQQGIVLSLQLAGAADPAPEDLDSAARHLLMAEPTALRQPKQALAYAIRANQLVHDTEPDYLMTLAKAQRANGDPQAARKTVEKLLGIHPSGDVRKESQLLLRQLDSNKH
ncbi:MAG: hypothetical protein P4L03_00440 [Terracidiphilus sp.]|nr:hypothetical protein [Terracidiphilus sp.]